MTALRQRKFQTQLLSRTDEQLQTLQDLVATIEFTQIQATVVHGLEQGNTVLKQLQKEMSLERVEKLMDETREGVEYQKEIDDALQSSMSAEDEEAVQRELEQLQAEQMVSYSLWLQADINSLRSQTSQRRSQYICRMRPSRSQRSQLRRLLHNVSSPIAS